MKSSDGVEGWDGATPVRGDRVTWVTDEKGKMELLEDGRGNDGWVSWLGFGVVRVRWMGGCAVGVAIHSTLCSDALSDILSSE